MPSGLTGRGTITGTSSHIVPEQPQGSLWKQKTTEEEEGGERAEEEETVRARQHAKMGKYGVGHSRSDERVGRPGKR